LTYEVLPLVVAMTVLKVCWQRHVEWLGRQRCAGRWSGNDMMAGRSGDNHLEGGSGDDNLAGEDGSDVLEGGAGNDVLSVEGITRDDLWLSRQGNSLLIDVWGSEDCVTAQDWYAGSALRLDAVQAGGSTLYAN
jgi:hypothetical protein